MVWNSLKHDRQTTSYLEALQNFPDNFETKRAKFVKVRQCLTGDSVLFSGLISILSTKMSIWNLSVLLECLLNDVGNNLKSLPFRRMMNWFIAMPLKNANAGNSFISAGGIGSEFSASSSEIWFSERPMVPSFSKLRKLSDCNSTSNMCIFKVRIGDPRRECSANKTQAGMQKFNLE